MLCYAITHWRRRHRSLTLSACDRFCLASLRIESATSRMFAAVRADRGRHLSSVFQYTADVAFSSTVNMSRSKAVHRSKKTGCRLLPDGAAVCCTLDESGDNIYIRTELCQINEKLASKPRITSQALVFCFKVIRPSTICALLLADTDRITLAIMLTRDLDL